MKDAYVKTDFNKGIATLNFYTPEHNALPTAILEKLEQEILSVGLNSDAKVIILKSGGDRTFCAGASFNELVAISNKEEGKEFFMGFAKVILAMRNCGKLILARVQGKAVGGGVGLAAAADYCFATRFASIKLSELSIGIGPFVIAPAVARKTGVRALSELTLNADRFFEPDWAQKNGLYNEVFDSAETMDDALQTFAERLASYNPEALRASKAIFWQDDQEWPQLLESRASISGNLVLSKFTKKALEKYK